MVLLLALPLAIGAPVEKQHPLVPPSFASAPFLQCTSRTVEIKSQVCNNICNNAAKFSCPSACRCAATPGMRAALKVISNKEWAALYAGAFSFRRLAPKKQAHRKGNKQPKGRVALASEGANYTTVGYYAPTWGMGSIGQDDANVGVAFSGWNDIEVALTESKDIDLKGTQYLSLGGSSEQGQFDPDTVTKMGEDCTKVKEAGYEGVVFDVEVTRGGMKLVKALEQTFAKCKEADLLVMVTTSHTAPAGVSLGRIRVKLIEAWVESSNIDIISPQLYSWGGEGEPEFDVTWPCEDCAFDKYKNSKAKFMPSVVHGDHMPTVKSFFKEKGIAVHGYFQWKPVLSAEDQEKADAAAAAEEKYAEEHADDVVAEPEEPAAKPLKHPHDEHPAQVEKNIKEDLKRGWLTANEAEAAQREYETMHEKGWALRDAE